MRDSCRLALTILVAMSLVACAANTVNVTIVERQGPAMGTGTADASRNSGIMRVNFPSKSYEGPWTAMRTSGGETQLLQQYGYVGATPIGGLATMTSDSRAGVGVANLRATDGDHLRCEFRYSIVGLTLSGIGVCRDAEGRLYDMQLAN